MYDPAKIRELKTAFAEALLRAPSQPVLAGRIAFPNDPQSAFRACNEWPFDAEVIAIQAELVKRHGAAHFLPSREDIANLVLAEAQATNFSGGKALAAEDRLKAYKLYCEIRGFIEKPGVQIDNRSVTFNRVMVVKDHGSNDEWGAKVASQQERLLEHAGGPKH